MNSAWYLPGAALCVLYTAAVLARILRQRLHAAAFMRQAQNADGRADAPPQPSVDVLVPCYNEAPELLDACLTSVVRQDYEGGLAVFVVDDGSRNREALLPVLERHGRRPGWRIVLLDANVGKRRALDTVLRLGHGKLVVTLDSDTVLRPDAIRQLVLPFADPRIGAVSATLRALNADANLLTRLIDRSYGMLFEQERAAQSRFRWVLCCCGGCTVFRRDALETVWDRYLGKTGRGRRYQTGDDLHLTLRLLERDLSTVLQPSAVAFTQVPETLRRYADQQRRWSRSFIRDLSLAARVIARRPAPAYVAFDVAVQAVGPVLLAVAALLAVLQGLLLGLEWLATGLVAIVATVLATSLAAAAQARDPRYLLYGAVYHAVVLPGYLVGLVSFGRDTWKTRSQVAGQQRMAFLRRVEPHDPRPETPTETPTEQPRALRQPVTRVTGTTGGGAAAPRPAAVRPVMGIAIVAMTLLLRSPRWSRHRT